MERKFEENKSNEGDDRRKYRESLVSNDPDAQFIDNGVMYQNEHGIYYYDQNSSEDELPLVANSFRQSMRESSPGKTVKNIKVEEVFDDPTEQDHINSVSPPPFP